MPQPTCANDARGLAVVLGGGDARACPRRGSRRAGSGRRSRQGRARARRSGRRRWRATAAGPHAAGTRGTRPCRPRAARRARRSPRGGAEADEDDREVVEVAQVRRRVDQRVQVLGVADVAGVHDDEPADEARARAPSRCRSAAASAPSCRPSSGSRGSGRGSRALRGEPLLHRLADRDDAVGPAEVEARQHSEQADEQGFLSRFSSTAISGRRPG